MGLIFGATGTARRVGPESGPKRFEDRAGTFAFFVFGRFFCCGESRRTGRIPLVLEMINCCNLVATGSNSNLQFGVLLKEGKGAAGTLTKRW